MTEKKFTYSKDIYVLIGEIMSMAYELNSTTKHAVFMRYYGHVNSFEIEIRKSKKDYETRASNDVQLYLLDYDGNPEIERLTEIRDNLGKILAKTKEPQLVL